MITEEKDFKKLKAGMITLIKKANNAEELAENMKKLSEWFRKYIKAVEKKIKELEEEEE